jgi:hypothetical protein
VSDHDRYADARVVLDEFGGYGPAGVAAVANALRIGGGALRPLVSALIGLAADLEGERPPSGVGEVEMPSALWRMSRDPGLDELLERLDAAGGPWAVLRGALGAGVVRRAE